MANRYWVGGSGTWNTTSTTNWSTASGGASGASAPTATDSVFFDSNSNVGTGAFTVTVSAAVCLDFNAPGTSTALDGAMTLAMGTSTLTVSGSWTNQATNFSITGTTGTITFNATTSKTITSNGVSFGCNVTFSGTGGTWQLQDALTTASSNTTTLTLGTLDLNNKSLTTGVFSSTNTNTRSIGFGTTGSIVLNSGTAGTTVLSMATATNFTFTGTSNIRAAMSVTRTFSFGGTAGSTSSNVMNLNLTSGASTPTATGNFRQIDFTGSTCTPTSTFNCFGFTLASGGTYTSATFVLIGTGTITFTSKSVGTLTINASGITATLQDNGTVTGTTTLTQGTLDLNNKQLTTSIFSSNNSNTRSIAFGSTGSIITNTASALQINLDMSTATNFTYTGTSNISAAMSTTRGFFFGDTAGATASNVMNINLTSGASVPTLTGSFKQVDFTGSTCNPGGVTINCAGFTLASGGTYSSTTFNSSLTSGTITFTGKSIASLTINASGITTTLQDTGTVVGTTTLTSGTLDLNNQLLNTWIFSSTNSNTRSIAFGSTGYINLNYTFSAALVLDMQTATNFTFTGTSKIQSGMSVTRTFSFGGAAGATASNVMNIAIISGSSTPTFSGTFRQIDFTGSTCNPGFTSIICAGFTLSSGGTFSNTTFRVGDQASGTLNFAGKTISGLLLGNTTVLGNTVTMQSAGTIGSLSLTNGTLDLAGYTLTNTGNATVLAGTKNLTFNGGTLLLSSNGASVWNNANPTNFTTTAGTGTGTISMTSASAKTFAGGGSTYNCTLQNAGAGALTISGSNTFTTISNSVQPTTFTFTAGTTQTVTNFNVSGTAGNLVTIGSTTTSAATLSKTTGTVSVSYCSISYSAATGGASWQAYTTNGNVNGGNNSGWIFSLSSGNFLVFF